MCIAHTRLCWFVFLSSKHVMYYVKQDVMSWQPNSRRIFYPSIDVKGLIDFLKVKYLSTVFFITVYTSLLRDVAEYRTRLGKSIIIVCKRLSWVLNFFPIFRESIFHCIGRVPFICFEEAYPWRWGSSLLL